VLIAPVLLVSTAVPAKDGGYRVPLAREVTAIQNVVPVPVSVTATPGVEFTLTADTAIYAVPETARSATYLAELLRRSTGHPLPVREAPAGRTPEGISLLLTGADPGVGEYGYQLDASAAAVVVRANRPAGVFAGVQTLRQLLPAAADSASRRPGPWTVPGGRIVDHPRFAYRSAMLDVARHFFSVADVKRYIDHLALLKLNYFHLHLTDDQGWRIHIDSWPELTAVGGRTQVGGGAGGFYTQDEYRDLVAYAQQRHITVVPEIDMPGHVNAALASYAQLNCDGMARPPFTGTNVGFSSLCVGKEITYAFVDDVVRELAAMTPGPYLHIGGDEADATSAADYRAFMNRAQDIVGRHGKTAVAWHQMLEVDGAASAPSAVAQYWGTETADAAVAAAAGNGRKLIMSPARTAYLDMKYDARTALGLDWAGFIEVRDAYEWEPATYLAGVPAGSVLGVEAPLWTETVQSRGDLEYLALPRLAAIAELGWSPPQRRGWPDFRRRLAGLGERWVVGDVNFYRSPQVAWR